MARWISKFQIALQSEGFSTLKPFSDLILADPNEYQFFEFRRIAGRNGVGVEVPVGFPYATFKWNGLPQTDIDVLKQYEGQFVFVRAETNEGVVRRFKYFTGFAQRLQLTAPNRNVAHDGNAGLRQRRAVSWEWSQLVEEPTIPDSFN